MLYTKLNYITLKYQDLLRYYGSKLWILYANENNRRTTWRWLSWTLKRTFLQRLRILVMNVAHSNLRARCDFGRSAYAFCRDTRITLGYILLEDLHMNKFCEGVIHMLIAIKAHSDDIFPTLLGAFYEKQVIYCVDVWQWMKQGFSTTRQNLNKSGS